MAIIDNLVAYWSLDEAAGANNAIDAHADLDLTQVSSPGSAEGKVSTARTFDTSDYFTRDDNASLSTGDIDFTVAGWCYLADVTHNMAIISKYTATGNQREYALYYNYNDHAPNSVFTFIVSSSGTSITQHNATDFGAASATTWYFVVAWHDAVNNQVGISVNGTATVAAYTSGVYDSSAATVIGRMTGVYPMNGRIDEVGFWKRVLTSDERTWLYNAGSGHSYSDIVAGMGTTYEDALSLSSPKTITVSPLLDFTAGITLQDVRGILGTSAIIQTTGQRFPTSGTSSAESPWLDQDWSSTQLICADDGQNATIDGVDFDTGDQTYVLKGYIFDFSSIPDIAIIDGIICRISAWNRPTWGTASIDLVQLLGTDRIGVGDNKASTPIALDLDTERVITFGTSDDLWGNALTASWIKNSNFGVGTGLLATGDDCNASVNYVNLEVFYHILGTAHVESLSFSSAKTIITESIKSIEDALSLSTSKTFSVSSLGVLEDSLNLIIQKTFLSNDPSLVIDGLITLAKTLSFLSDFVSAFEIDDIILEWVNTYEESISLVLSKALNSSGYVVIEGIIDLTIGRGILVVSATGITSGSTVWGHITGVTEDNARTFADNWTGTGAISGLYDEEKACLDSGEILDSEVVQTGVVLVTLLYDTYGTGTFAGTLLLQYRHGNSVANCELASWNAYTVPFMSDGYVQIRIEAP